MTIAPLSLTCVQTVGWTSGGRQWRTDSDLLSSFQFPSAHLLPSADTQIHVVFSHSLWRPVSVWYMVFLSYASVRRWVSHKGTHCNPQTPPLPPSHGQEAEVLGHRDKLRLLEKHKLALVVDLDQTLIHTSVDPYIEPGLPVRSSHYIHTIS